jgi:hypothetical protein
MLVMAVRYERVDPSSGYQVVNSLIQAGKYFDLLVMCRTEAMERAANTPPRKRNDFFVQWLLGTQPPD